MPVFPSFEVTQAGNLNTPHWQGWSIGSFSLADWCFPINTRRSSLLPKGKLSDGAQIRIVSVTGFHEKAGRSQVGLARILTPKQGFPSAGRYCRHPSIRTLSEQSALGASWVFSLQPVLPSV